MYNQSNMIIMLA